MGFIVAAVVANLCVEFYEELAPDSAPLRPKLWKRYVDDTCCVKFIMELKEDSLT